MEDRYYIQEVVLLTTWVSQPGPELSSGMTAHLQLSLLKTVDLLLIGSREELNSMYLSNSITLSSQLNIYQMLGCKNSINGGKRHAFLWILWSYLQISQTYRDLQGAGVLAPIILAFNG